MEKLPPLIQVVVWQSFQKKVWLLTPQTSGWHLCFQKTSIQTFWQTIFRSTCWQTIFRCNFIWRTRYNMDLYSVRENQKKTFILHDDITWALHAQHFQSRKKNVQVGGKSLPPNHAEDICQSSRNHFTGGPWSRSISKNPSKTQPVVLTCRLLRKIPPPNSHGSACDMPAANSRLWTRDFTCWRVGHPGLCCPHVLRYALKWLKKHIPQMVLPSGESIVLFFSKKPPSPFPSSLCSMHLCSF